MTEYKLTYQLTPDMLQRAMMSWANPLRSRAQKLRRGVFGFIIFCVLVTLLVVLLRYEIVTNGNLVGLLVGFYGAIGLWFVTHRYSSRKLFGFSNDALARHGPVEAVFNADHVTMTSKISTGQMGWLCFDDITALADATVLRAGGMVYAVPDAALPDGVTPAAFRADLTRWKEATAPEKQQ